MPPGIKLIRSIRIRACAPEGDGSILEAFKPGTAPPDSYSAAGSDGGLRSGGAQDVDKQVGSGTGGLY